MSKRRCPACDQFVPDHYWKIVQSPKDPEWNDQYEDYEDPEFAWLANEIFEGTWRHFACAKCGHTEETVELSVRGLLRLTADAPSRSEYVARQPLPEVKKGPPTLPAEGTYGPHRLVTASKELAIVVGGDEQPRSHAVAKFWKHVQDRELVKPKNRRVIVPDSYLLDAIRAYCNREELEIRDVPDFFSVHLEHHERLRSCL